MSLLVSGALAMIVGTAVGLYLGVVTRRVDATKWKSMAVEMARMNHALMDRVEALEAERQKEN